MADGTAGDRNQKQKRAEQPPKRFCFLEMVTLALAALACLAEAWTLRRRKSDESGSTPANSAHVLPNGNDDAMYIKHCHLPGLIFWARRVQRQPKILSTLLCSR